MKSFICLLILILTGCGAEYSQPVAPVPSTPGIPTIPSQPVDNFLRATQIHDQFCIACHANSGFIQSENAFRSSNAQIRVRNGSMPPPNAPLRMPDIVRAEYLEL